MPFATATGDATAVDPDTLSAIAMPVVFHLGASRRWREPSSLAGIVAEVQRIFQPARILIRPHFVLDTLGTDSMDVNFQPVVTMRSGEERAGLSRRIVSVNGITATRPPLMHDAWVRDSVAPIRIDGVRPTRMPTPPLSRAAGVRDTMITVTPREANVAMIAAHEIGHSLNLEHREVPSQLMGAPSRGWALTREDIVRMRSTALRNFHGELLPRPGRVEFPPKLLAADSSAVVRVRYAVDDNGAVVMSTVAVETNAAPVFANAVLRALPGMRFPARATQRSEVYDFHAPREAPPVYGEAIDTLAGGVIRKTLGRPRRDPGAAAQMSPADLVEAQRVVLLSVFNNVRSATLNAPWKTVFCVRGSPAGDSAVPDSALLRQVTQGHWQGVTEASCPPRVPVTGGRGRGRGGAVANPRDPWTVVLGGISPWTPSTVRMDVRVSGNEDRTFRCAAAKEAAGWRSVCERR